MKRAIYNPDAPQLLMIPIEELKLVMAWRSQLRNIPLLMIPIEELKHRFPMENNTATRPFDDTY